MREDDFLKEMEDSDMPESMKKAFKEMFASMPGIVSKAEDENPEITQDDVDDMQRNMPKFAGALAGGMLDIQEIMKAAMAEAREEMDEMGEEGQAAAAEARERMEEMLRSMNAIADLDPDKQKKDRAP